VQGWPSTGEVADSRIASVWMAPERARWAREEKVVAQELADGAAIFELHYAGHRYLAREILKEAGDAVVLEPDDARHAILEAAEALAGAAQR
jgi:proteasome accessory factor C